MLSKQKNGRFSRYAYNGIHIRTRLTLGQRILLVNIP